MVSSIYVVEQKHGPQFIFGLDNLKRHQCSIDLKSNTLRFGSCNVELPFVPPPGDEAPSSPTAAGPSTVALGPSSAVPHAAPPPTAAAPMPVPPVAASRPAVPTGGPSGGDPAHEAAVRQLMALGFPRERVETALQAAGGNSEIAASMLFGV